MQHYITYTNSVVMLYQVICMLFCTEHIFEWRGALDIIVKCEGFVCRLY